jgi:2,3-bisphosphoglycerate-independent phosphoglycerate mutase
MGFLDYFKKTKLSDKPPVVLLILDGWGYAHAWGGNAVTMGDTPNFDKLWTGHPHFTLKAAEAAVGLPEMMPGNSEVGHVAIGAGKVVHQHLYLINKAIEDGSFFQNEELIKAMQIAKDRGSKLHILGMLSLGTQVHGSIDHVYQLCKLAKDHGLSQVYIHGFSDGRDAPQREGFEQTHRLETKLNELGVGQIATISGRYFGMDRNKRYERTQRTYKAMVLGQGEKYHSTEEVFAKSYSQDVTDEYILPSVLIDANQKPVAVIEDNDVVIFANFRADRTRQISKALCNSNFNGFHRQKWPQIYFCSMAYYSPNLPSNIAFKIKPSGIPLAEVISKANLSQFHIAESQKYPHVTYFINGGREDTYPNEYRQLIPSIEDISYDQKPRMCIDKVASSLVDKINANKYDAYICNFANPDMVGHTGDLSATIEACEATDECLGDIWEAVAKRNGILMVTADHGNAEQMINIETGRPDPEHTRNPVPFMVCDPAHRIIINPDISDDYVTELRDIAPSMLYLLGLEKDQSMTGQNLIKFK